MTPLGEPFQSLPLSHHSLHTHPTLHLCQSGLGMGLTRGCQSLQVPHHPLFLLLLQGQGLLLSLHLQFPRRLQCPPAPPLLNSISILLFSILFLCILAESQAQQSMVAPLIQTLRWHPPPAAGFGLESASHLKLQASELSQVGCVPLCLSLSARDQPLLGCLAPLHQGPQGGWEGVSLSRAISGPSWLGPLSAATAPSPAGVQTTHLGFS